MTLMTRRSLLLPEAVTRRLAGQLTGTGPAVTAYAPWTGEPLVDMRSSTVADVSDRVRKSPRRAGAVGRDPAGRAGQGVRALPRPGAAQPAADGPHPGADRQDPLRRVRGDRGRRRHGVVLRPERARVPRTAAAQGRAAARHPGHRAAAPQGRRVGHLAVQLPAVGRDLRRHPGAHGGQRRGVQAGHADRAHAAARAGAADQGRPAGRVVADRRRRAGGDRPRARSTAPTTSASPAATWPGSRSPRRPRAG